MGTHPIFESDFDRLTDMDRLKSAFGGGSSGESDLSPITEVAGGENSSLCPSMGFKDRMIGFGVCTGIGILLSIGGSINIFLGNLKGFAILYTFGTLCAICGTGFLRGPVKQIKAMADPNRLVAVLIMLVMIVLTILSATVWANGILCIIFCILQFLSYCWYCLSFIPYGRETVMGCCKSCV